MKVLRESTAWKRRGSSIIFDHELIKDLLDSSAMVSLREFMSWKNAPATPPFSGKTVMVCGLDVVLDALSPDDALDFLTMEIRPVIIEIQQVWPDVGVVFGFSGAKAFSESTMMSEEVLFARRDDSHVRISEGLWDGTATLNMQRLETQFAGNQQWVPSGYYVARIS